MAAVAQEASADMELAQAATPAALGAAALRLAVAASAAQAVAVGPAEEQAMVDKVAAAPAAAVGQAASVAMAVDNHPTYHPIGVTVVPAGLGAQH